MHTKQTNETLKHLFPQHRPDVKIVESNDRITEVDCPELQWWFAVPEMGEPHFRVEYDANTLELDAIVEITPTEPVTIRGIDCVGLQVTEWLAPRDWPDVNPPVMMYATLDDTHSRWVSVVNIVDGEQVSYTVGDEWFEEDWGGPLKRRIVDDGRYELQPDGSYRITEGQGFGAGTYNVTIGENTFHCLRILDVDISEPHGGELAEIYIESGGRTVFFRRYDGRYLRGHDLVAKYPNNRRIVINDTVYVHSDSSGWAHDQFTSAALRPTF